MVRQSTFLRLFGALLIAACGIDLHRGVFAQGSSAPSKREARTLASAPPFPYSTKKPEILSNVAFGLLSTVPLPNAKWPPLPDPLRASRILSVTGEGPVADYFVVELLDAAGLPLADVVISKSGYLISVWPFQPDTPRRLAPDLDEVRTKLARRFGTARVYYSHAFTNIEYAGGSEYVPLVTADTPQGRFYVNSEHELYREASFTRHGRSLVDTMRAAKTDSPDKKWRITKTGRCHLEKEGSLLELP